LGVLKKIDWSKNKTLLLYQTKTNKSKQTMSLTIELVAQCVEVLEKQMALTAVMQDLDKAMTPFKSKMQKIATINEKKN